MPNNENNLLVTGKWGESHVTSGQARNYNAAIVGGGKYVHSGFGCSIEDANTAHISGGIASFNGADIELPSSGQDVTIENGSQGMQRIDVVALVYSRDNDTLTESVMLQMFKGTPAATSPQPPTIPDTDIRDGDNPAYMPLWQIPINGITVGTPVQLFDTRGPMDDLTNFGINATANELNTLDGITATTAELNRCDGVTSNIQTQLNAKAATSTVNSLTSRVSTLETNWNNISQYSTSERATGEKWINNKPVYRKVVAIPAITGNKATTVSHGISFTHVIRLDVMMWTSSGVCLPLARVGYASDASFNERFNSYAQMNATAITIYTGSNTAYAGGYAIVEYTK